MQQITVSRHSFHFRYRHAVHFVEVFRTLYGPIHKAFATLPGGLALALECALIALLDRLNVAGPDALAVPSECLEVVITRR